MTLLNKTDFLADIQFIDYWDVKPLLKGKTADFLANIQFIDYWDSEFFSNELDSGVSIEQEDTDVLFIKKDTLM